MSDAKEGIVYIALINKQIAGYLAGGLIKIRPWRKEKRAVEIENMYVTKSKRKLGIGTAFVAKFIKWAKKNAVDRLKVEAVYENTIGRNFYEKHGLKEYSVIYECDI